MMTSLLDILEVMRQQIDHVVQRMHEAVHRAPMESLSRREWIIPRRL